MPLDIIHSGDGVNFGPLATTGYIEKILILADVFLDNSGSIEDTDAGNSIITQTASAAPGLVMGTIYPDNRIWFIRSWDGGNGSWGSSTDFIGMGAWTQIGVYYNGASTDNKPRFYADGVGEDAPTTYFSPDGNLRNVSSDNLQIGTAISSGNPYTLDGMIERVRIYDLTSSGWDTDRVDLLVVDAYNGESLEQEESFLVFACDFIGASGIQNYDGASLSSDNNFIDDISGVSGEVMGTPSGVGLTHLSL